MGEASAGGVVSYSGGRYAAVASLLAPPHLEPRKELVEELHLSGVLPEVGSIAVGGAGLGAGEEVGMVADLAELHEDVLEGGLGGTSNGIELDGLLLENLGVVVDLHVSETDKELRGWSSAGRGETRRVQWRGGWVVVPQDSLLAAGYVTGV